jgi:hypothetical protein
MNFTLDSIITWMPVLIAALGVALAAFAVWRADRSAHALATNAIAQISPKDQETIDEAIKAFVGDTGNFGREHFDAGQLAVDPETYQHAARVVLAGRIKTR